MDGGMVLMEEGEKVYGSSSACEQNECGLGLKRRLG